eukprot:3084031-Pleurochrysis_carterae.AAC.2
MRSDAFFSRLPAHARPLCERRRRVNRSNLKCRCERRSTWSNRSSNVWFVDSELAVSVCVRALLLQMSVQGKLEAVRVTGPGDSRRMRNAALAQLCTAKTQKENSPALCHPHLRPPTYLLVQYPPIGDSATDTATCVQIMTLSGPSVLSEVQALLQRGARREPSNVFLRTS